MKKVFILMVKLNTWSSFFFFSNTPHFTFYHLDVLVNQLQEIQLLHVPFCHFAPFTTSKE